MAPVVVIGPQTARNEDLVLQGMLRVFTIHFQPAGFHHLFGVPMRKLTDQAFGAKDVLGPDVVRLHERLQEAGDDHERITLIESWLRARFRSLVARDPVHQATHAILAGYGGGRRLPHTGRTHDVGVQKPDDIRARSARGAMEKLSGATTPQSIRLPPLLIL